MTSSYSAIEADGSTPSVHPLADRIEQLLKPLGGHSAVAARTFAQATMSTTPPVVMIRAEHAFPAASLAKLPIAVELARRVDLGALDWTERFEIVPGAHAGGGSILDALDRTWQPTLADLCALMLGVSDNTAANRLLDLIGMGEVNETMTRLGLSGTRLQRRFMDLAARGAGHDNVTTARDMLALLSLLRSNALPHAARLRAMLTHDPRTEASTFDLPPTAELAHKSGILDDTIHAAGFLNGPSGSCAYCILTDEQHDLPYATLVCARVLRLLWEAWCAA